MDKNKVDFDYFAENYQHNYQGIKIYLNQILTILHTINKRQKSAINFKPLKILDYGCGIGKLIPEIKKFSHSEIYGYEVSKKSLEVALSRFSYLKTFNANDKYDSIIFFGSFSSLSE